MYSAAITARDIRDIESALGRSLDWYPVADSVSITAHIQSLVDTDGRLIRPLTDEEQRFVHDERLRCKYDFSYFALRYIHIKYDSATGGLGPMGLSADGEERELWGSQQLILSHLGYCEDRMWDDYDRQIAAAVDDSLIRVSGIWLVIHKARQLGATVLAQALILHRFIFSQNMRLVVASEDQTKTEEILEDKTLVMWSHLPWFFQPRLKFKTKDVGLRCEELDTTIFLQHAKQEGGLAMGGTTHGGHLTELGNWPKQITDQLQNHFYNSIPWSLQTLIIEESLAQGQGNFWHRHAMASLSPDTAGRAHGVFIPWYVEKSKYRKYPPPGWQPKTETLKYAYRVYQTSPLYVGSYAGSRWAGKAVTLDSGQLYFYEDGYAKAEKDGVLADFLQNYPATPEESFQSRSSAPFTPQVLARMSRDCRDPIRQMEWMGATARVGDRGPRPADLTIRPEDPRGIIRVYSKPDRHSRYVMAVDTAPGIDGWNRRLATPEDWKKDNCAVQIVRIGFRGEPDEQVAEFIAPIDYVAAAPIVNYMGRLFRGRDDEMCLLGIETGPTSGEAMIERLIHEYGYWNIYIAANQLTRQMTRRYGWEANQRNVHDLWFRTKPHIAYHKLMEVPDRKSPTGVRELSRVKFIPRSAYLVDTEMRHCEEDPKRQIAKAEYGYHDDALRALQIALYIAHDWQSYGEAGDVVSEAPPASARPDWQARDCSAEEMRAEIDGMLEPEGETW